MKNLLMYLLFFFSFSAAAQQTVTYGSVSGSLYSNIPYKSGSTLTQYEKDRCKLDIYIPKTAGKAPFPVVVYFYGGGLNSGDKSEGWADWSNNFGYKFLESGVAMVMVNYRLSGQQGVKWPAYIQDAAASVAWVTNNIQNYGGDANNVFVMGFSAGAYLTHMLAIDPTWYNQIGFDRSRIRGYLPMSGQPRAHGTVAADLGTTADQLMTVRPDAMPLGHVKKTEKPMHLFVGANEGQTITDNYEYYNQLIGKGSTDLFIYTNPGKDHGGMRDGLGDAVSPTRTKMLDFIKTYSVTAGSSSSSSASGTQYIQAESYSAMSGVTVEATTDTSGGNNIGSIDTNDWMTYNSIYIPVSGTYTIAYRVASATTGGKLQLEQAGGGIVYGTANIPVTGGWQAWTTVYQTVTFNAGTVNLGIKALAGGWNLNWFSITPVGASSSSKATTSSSLSSSSSSSSVSSIKSSVASSSSVAPVYVQAESYNNMSGVVIGTSSAEAGQVVGSIDTNDWMTYNNVNIPAAGNYIIAYRVASLNGGGIARFEEAGGGTLYGTTNIPKTNGWDIWTTVYQTVNLSAGNHNFGIKAGVGGWNLNWFSITPVSSQSSSIQSSNDTCPGGSGIYPNCASSRPSLSSSSSSLSSIRSSSSSLSSIASTSSSKSSSSVSSVAVSSSSSSAITTLVQAESYANMSGVIKETTTDTGGGEDVGSLDTNDWVSYNNVYVPAPGTYTVAYRVASLAGGGKLQLEQAGATEIYGSVDIPTTGGWQTWTTVYQTVTIRNGGALSIGIKALSGGFNLNWFSITEGTSANSSSSSSSSSAGSGFEPKEKVMNYLRSISGKQIVFGVENKNTGTPTSDTDHITSISGLVSGYWGADFGFGSGAVNNRQNMTNEAIRQWNKGAIIQLMYHTCSPTQDEYCGWDDIGGAHPIHLTDAQWIDLTTPGQPLYNVWISRLDTLAGYFQQLKDAGVAPTFRPFHEVNQCIFWWSCKTGPNGSARLYQITHDYLTYNKGLTNIIWNWNIQDINVSALSSDIAKYNPGQAYFDIVSLDVYGSAGYNSTIYNAMVDIAQGKPMGIGECMHFPSVSTLASQPNWAFAMMWPDFLYDSSKTENEATIKAMYPTSQVITLDEMPGWK